MTRVNVQQWRGYGLPVGITSEHLTQYDRDASETRITEESLPLPLSTLVPRPPLWVDKTSVQVKSQKKYSELILDNH